MHWKGYAGGVVGSGGALGCEGAMRLHWLQLALWDLMAVVMPGQNTAVSSTCCHGRDTLVRRVQCFKDVLPE